MAVTGDAAVTGGTPRQFAQLKLRLLANGLKGSSGRVALFVGGAVLGLFFASIGLLLFAFSAAGGADARLLTSALGGGVLVLGAALLPLIWFGVDDSLDPARFALLPLSRRRLVVGLFAAALLSIPALCLLLATTGLLVPATVHGGFVGGAAQALGVVGGLLLCIAVSRAVTSAFATMLRSRRMRDFAGILLATLAALIGPAQLMLVSALEDAGDLSGFTTVATVLGWSPLAAPYTVGYEVAAGAPAAAVAKLAITGACVAALLWWWSRSLESAMVGAAAASGGGRARQAVPRGGAVAALLPRWLPGLSAGPTGALVARELRYWWRDAKRRANLVSIAAVGVLLPLVLAYTGGFTGSDTDAAVLTEPTPLLFIMLFVGSFAAMVLANQFGFDGTAYATHLTAAVTGRRELAARMVALALLMLPVVALVVVLLVALGAAPGAAVGGAGLALAGYGTGAAINSGISVLAAYPVPEGANPFATSTGAGFAKSMLAMVSLIAGYVAAIPLLSLALVTGGTWPWLAIPLGAGYGFAAAALGCVIVGDLVDRRAPELLTTVTPRS